MGNVVNLTKGSSINLSKQSDGLNNIIVGLGWDQADNSSSDIDCDAGAFLLINGKLKEGRDTIYYSNMTHDSRSIAHTGDNLTGEGEGDDEQISVKLKDVPERFSEIVLYVNIYRAKQRKQSFGMIRNAYIRIVNCDNNVELCRYNLSNYDEYSKSTTVVFGSLKKLDNEWEFIAFGTPSDASSISELADEYK